MSKDGILWKMRWNYWGSINGGNLFTTVSWTRTQFHCIIYTITTDLYLSDRHTQTATAQLLVPLLASWSGGFGFKSQPADRLSWDFLMSFAILPENFRSSITYALDHDPFLQPFARRAVNSRSPSQTFLWHTKIKNFYAEKVFFFSICWHVFYWQALYIALMHCASSRNVTASIPDGVIPS